MGLLVLIAVLRRFPCTLLVMTPPPSSSAAYTCSPAPYGGHQPDARCGISGNEDEYADFYDYSSAGEAG